MTEQELRSLVRDAIARHMGAEGQVQSLYPPTPFSLPSSTSFSMFVLPSGADSEGPCIIEPSVMCNHCGYCKSYGH
jgi:hypothetical protein